MVCCLQMLDGQPGANEFIVFLRLTNMSNSFFAVTWFMLLLITLCNTLLRVLLNSNMHVSVFIYTTDIF